MKKIFLIFSLLPLAAFAETDAQFVLNQAIEIARTNCSGISARMDKIKKMAGIGTAINAVGAATGAVGVGAGIVKYNKDKEIQQDVVEKQGVDLLIKKLQEQESFSVENQNLLAKIKKIDSKIETNLNALESETEAKTLSDKSIELGKKINENQKKSTVAGNVRTGMFAIDTATNVAGAITASKTVADDDFIAQIKKCIESVDELRTAHSRSKFEDGNDINVQQMDLGQKIISKCGEYQYVDFTPLNNLAKGAMVANSVGAATGVVATITSVLGNNQKMSNINVASQESVDKANKNLKMNVASNVMGGVTAAASLTGTVLSASQIKTAKQALNIAQECEEALKW